MNTVHLNWRTATPLIIDLYRILPLGRVLIATLGYNVRQYTASTGDTGRAQYMYVVVKLAPRTALMR
jgi:hypothetical protein